MAVNVETLEKLERRITLTLSLDTVQSEVSNRLTRLSRTVKADGFRPGKVPMSVVAQRYGYSVHSEVMNDKVGQAFAAAATEARLRVAGAPRITERQSPDAGELAFDAVFEVYPEVTIGDLATAQVERYSTDVTDAAIDRTIDILRKQRRTFAQRSTTEGAAEGDRVKIDFEGKIDGVPFDGGKASDFQFVVGEGQMLEAFDKAVRGMKVGESKTFPLQFPDDYQGKEVAGKEADFLVTLKKLEMQNLPVLDDAFAQSLGISQATVEGLQQDVRKNLEREVKARVMTRNKASVMEALLQVSQLEVPAALVDGETERMVEAARADLKQRGVKDADKAPIPAELFKPQAERRVRLGLVVAELVRSNGLQAKPDQLQAHIEEMSLSYEKPSEVVRWYLGDRQRMAEVEAVVVENNVADFVLARAQAAEKHVPFDELMAG
jgi:trigger factor